MVARFFLRADTGPTAFLCVGAIGLATGHLTKLATDPHTPYAKSHETRRWEERIPFRYHKQRWNDVMTERKA